MMINILNIPIIKFIVILIIIVSSKYNIVIAILISVGLLITNRIKTREHSKIETYESASHAQHLHVGNPASSSKTSHVHAQDLAVEAAKAALLAHAGVAPAVEPSPPTPQTPHVHRHEIVLSIKGDPAKFAADLASITPTQVPTPTNIKDIPCSSDWGNKGNDGLYGCPATFEGKYCIGDDKAKTRYKCNGEKLRPQSKSR
jgi:hypothetical protein